MSAMGAVATTPHLRCSEEFDPALFMSESWSAAEEDERANRITEIDASSIVVVTALKNGEQSITGEERVKRLKEMPYIRLGGRAFLGLAPVWWRGEDFRSRYLI